MTTMDEIARTFPRKSALMYLATPSMMSLSGDHEAHIASCRDRAVAVGLSEAEADRILEEVRREVSDLPRVDGEYARRLFAAVNALPD